MKVFLDTNVVLDFLLAREGFYEDARTVIRFGGVCMFVAYICHHCHSPISLISPEKKYSGEAMYDLLAGLREFIKVTPVDQKVVDMALRSSARDFEDALQYYSALKSGADILLTRNVADYAFDGITIATPREFINNQNDR